MFTSPDANTNAFAGGVISAFNAGELDAATFVALAAIPDAAGFEAATESLLPDVTNSAVVQVFESVNNVGRLINRRIVNTLDKDIDRLDNEGLDFVNVESGFWADGSYRFADQSNTSDFGASTEYDATSFAFSGGYERAFAGNALIGIAGTYSNVDIDQDRQAADEIDVDIFNISVYGARRIQQLSVSGQVGYTFGDVSAERTALTGLVTSDYDVDGFNAKFDASYDLLLRKDAYFAPLVGVRYSGISADAFTETGGLGLTIESGDTNIVEFEAGAITGREIKFGDALLDTYARVVYVNDISRSDSEFRANFGTQSIVLDSVSNADERVELSGGADFYSNDRFSIGASVDSELANDYTSIGGTIRLKALF